MSNNSLPEESNVHHLLFLDSVSVFAKYKSGSITFPSAFKLYSTDGSDPE